MAKKSVYLPEDVIKEIMLRLPVKSVLRCKCVCKLWLSIISRPHFANSHFQLAASPTHRLMILGARHAFKAYDPQILSVDFNASLNDDSAYHSPSLDFLPRPHFLSIRGSCRGFLLLEFYSYFYIWNPSTGVSKQIPMSPIALPDDEYILKFLYGLAYQPSTDDYLVVFGSNEYDGNFDPVSNSIDLEIFSLRADKWKQVKFDSHLPYENLDNFNELGQVGSILNGSIHWLVYNYETKMFVIIAFDLKETTMSEIALPDYFEFWSMTPLDFDVLVLNGLISACIVQINTVKI